jgi:hypothetical protein
MLLGLIDQTPFGNQELRILNEDVQTASNEVLARQGINRVNKVENHRKSLSG